MSNKIKRFDQVELGEEQNMTIDKRSYAGSLLARHMYQKHVLDPMKKIEEEHGTEAAMKWFLCNIL